MASLLPNDVFGEIYAQYQINISIINVTKWKNHEYLLRLIVIVIVEQN